MRIIFFGIILVPLPGKGKQFPIFNANVPKLNKLWKVNADRKNCGFFI